MGEGDGFLSRWSKRKMERAAPVPPEAAAAPATTTPTVAPLAAASPATTTPPVAPLATVAPAATGNAVPAPSAVAAPAPLPGLDDVARLTRESDYAPYVNRAVDPQVRNAAMKKLFSDPHFNVMDGLDTYVDDYGKPDPLPLSMLRQMSSARALGLFAEEEAAEAKALAAAQGAANPRTVSAPAQDPAKAIPDGAAPTVLAQSPPEEIEPPHEDTDLRLQPDDASGRASPGGCAGRPG
jgi:Protein of unknown function (DUF3306)